MFTLSCEKHRQESKEWFILDRVNYPDSTDRERIGRRLVAIATGPVEEPCQDCKILSETK